MAVGLGGLVVNRFLKFSRGTKRSSFAQLYVAFFLSGLLHFCGEFMIEKRMVYRAFKFFPLQAIAITSEGLAISIANRLLRWRGIELKPGKIDESWAEFGVRVVGYCWVSLCFSWTLPVYLDGLSVLGFNSNDREPIIRFLVDTWKQWA